MNGYASMNAAITVDGNKKSLPAASPQGVFMDLTVLAGAPARMIRAGLGDALCRSTAQADWLLSRHLLGTRTGALRSHFSKPTSPRCWRHRSFSGSRRDARACAPSCPDSE
jgi:glycerol dehydrogenase-like iron-containing ADH family enzyme